MESWYLVITRGYPWISGYLVGLDMGRHPCPWILSWAAYSDVDGFGFGSGFGISARTRPIAILSEVEVFR